MQPLKLVVVGHVDHGKSTLIGRLLYDTGALPEGRLQALEVASAKRGMPFEWAFALDALQAERDQGISVETSQIQFKSGRRNYVLIDAPGHKEFLKNMVTGASQADAGVLVVDAVEGLQDQTRRHAYLLRLIGLSQLVVVINKMDLVGRDESRFLELRREILQYLADIDLPASSIAVIPMVARSGENLCARGEALSWFEGPTFVEALDAVAQPPAATEMPLRFPVQDVYKFDARRIVAGRVESGHFHVGDTLLFSPANKLARVRSIEGWNARGPLMNAVAGQSIGVMLEEDVFVERGQVASHVHLPPKLTNVFKASLFWLGRKPMNAGGTYHLRHGTSEMTAVIEKIERVIDVNDLSTRTGEALERNGVAEAIIRVKGMIAVDDHAHDPRLGRFVLVDGHEIAGGGIVDTRAYPDQRRAIAPRSGNLARVEHRVAIEERAAANAHTGGILWMTGLSGAGKTTLATQLERILFDKGFQVFLLDGDNVRQGLSADLGFSPEDRTENIRRVGEVAALFAESGMLVVTAFISPYRADRDRIRAQYPAKFHEIFVHAPLEVCEKRDNKGLYRKARAGELKEFTGISSPYEPPIAPEVVLDTHHMSVDECLSRLNDYVETHFRLARAVAAVARHHRHG